MNTLTQKSNQLLQKQVHEVLQTMITRVLEFERIQLSVQEKKYQLEDLVQLLYSEARSLQLDRTLTQPITTLSLRTLIEVVLMNSDVLVSRVVTTLLSKQNPVPLLNPTLIGMKFMPAVFYLWEVSYPTVLSFGIGPTSGKSTLLNQLFMSSFEQHKNTIYFESTLDIDFGYYFITKRPINIADFHGQPTKEWIIKLQDLFDGFLIQVTGDYLNQKVDIVLEYLNILPAEKFQMIISRDTSEDYIFPNALNLVPNKETLPNIMCQDDSERNFFLENLRDRIFNEVSNMTSTASQLSTSMKRNLKRKQLLNFVNPESADTLNESTKIIETLKTHLLESQTVDSSRNYPVYSLFVQWCEAKQKLSEMTFYGSKIDDMFNLQHEVFKKHQQLQSTYMNQCGVIFEDFVDLLSKPNTLMNLDILTSELKFEKSLYISQSSLAGDLTIEKSLSIEVLWRNAIICYKYQQSERKDIIRIPYQQYIEAGFPFEIVDGDNFYFHYAFLFEALSYFKNQNVLVISIIGPQNSGKSTLLNYMFGTLFDVRDGRCTRGIYGSFVKSNSKSFDYIMLIDTEGLSSAEKQDLKYDRRIVLFCLAVSHLVIINIKGDLDDSMKRIVTLCADSLKHVGVNRVPKPIVHFVLNQKSGSLDVTNHDEVIKKVLDSLKTHNLHDVIQLTKDTFHTLPLAYKSKRLSEADSNSPSIIQTDPEFIERAQLLCGKVMDSAICCFDRNKAQFSDPQQWLTFANTLFDVLLKFPDLTYFFDINEKKTDLIIREFLRNTINTELTSERKQEMKNKTLKMSNIELNEYIDEFFSSEVGVEKKLLEKLENELQQKQASDIIRKRAKEFLTIQLTGIKNAWKTSALQANDRFKTEELRHTGGEEMRSMIERMINSGISETEESAEQKFEQMWEQKLLSIRRRFSIDERLNTAINYVYINYHSYQTDNLQDSSWILQFFQQIPEFTFSKLNNFEAVMRSVFVQQASRYPRVKEVEYLSGDLPNYSSEMLKRMKYLNKNLLLSLWTGEKPVTPLYTRSDRRLRYNRTDENNDLEIRYGFNGTLQEYLNPYYEENTKSALEYFFLVFAVLWKFLKGVFVSRSETFRKDVLKMLTEDSLTDPEKNMLPLLIVFEFVYNRMMLSLIMTGNYETITPIDGYCIQNIVWLINSCIAEIDGELNLFGAVLSKHVSSENNIAILLLTKLYYKEQHDHFEEQIAALNQMKSGLKSYFFRMVISNKKMDSEFAESVTQQISIGLNAELNEKAVTIMTNAINNDEEYFTREGLIKYCESHISTDSDITTENDQWHADYIMNPNNAILKAFDERWKEKEKEMSGKIKQQQNHSVVKMSDYIFALNTILTYLREENRSGTLVIDNLFETSTGDADTNLINKGKLVSSILYSYLTNQKIEETYCIGHNQYKLKNLDQFEMLVKPNQDVVDLMSRTEIRNQFEQCSVSDLFGLLEKLIELATKVKEEFKSQSIGVMFGKGKKANRTVQEDSSRDIHQDPSGSTRSHQNPGSASSSSIFGNSNQLFQQLRVKARGCGALCPCCKKQCDVDHTRVMTQAGSEFNKHACRTGHQYRAMGGTKLEITNEASIKLCEDIKDGHMIIVNGNQRITWRDFKVRHKDWDFGTELISHDQLHEIRGKSAVLWARIGETLCRKEYPGMVYVKSNIEPVHHFILLLDNSGSMNGKPWNDLMVAVEKFISLRKDLPNSDLISVIVFGNQADIACCNEDIKVFDVMSKIKEKDKKVGGGTSFSRAFAEVSKTIKTVNEQKKVRTICHSIIFLSDGDASYPATELETLSTQYRQFILNFWTMALGNEKRAILEKINETMNGTFKNITNSSDLITAYAEIAATRQAITEEPV